MFRKPQFGLDSARHVVVTGSARRTVALHLEPEGARVRLGSTKELVLPWPKYRELLPVLGTPNPPDEWHITPFVTRWASAGLAILVSGAFADEAHDLHAASMTLFRRLNHGWPDRSSGLTLPIVPDSVPIVLDSELIVFDGFAGPCERELTTLDALCRVLSAEPELRARLDEPENMAILTKGLAERSLVRAPDKSGLRRDSIDIVHAMHSCGFRHRFGRPLPDDQLPSLTEVVERTMAALATNKFRVGRSIDRSEVEKYARCNFTDVEPWPFEGLVPSRA